MFKSEGHKRPLHTQNMTNTQSAALGPNQEKRLKTLQKTFHKYENLKTASIPHGQLTETETMRLAELLTHHYTRIIIIPVKSGRASHFLLCFIFPHRHCVCLCSHPETRRDLLLCLCVSGSVTSHAGTSLH